MKDKVNLSGEVEPIRTGRPFGERRPAGKIYAVDPRAVARLKGIMAEKEKQRETAVEAGNSDIMGNILRTQHERQAALNARKRKPEIAANLAREWHITFYQAGFSAVEVAEWAGVGRKRLLKRWRELGLPVSRRVAERAWPEADAGNEQ